MKASAHLVRDVAERRLDLLADPLREIPHARRMRALAIAFPGNMQVDLPGRFYRILPSVVRIGGIAVDRPALRQVQVQGFADPPVAVGRWGQHHLDRGTRCRDHDVRLEAVHVRFLLAQ